MKIKLLNVLTSAILLLVPVVSFAQAPSLGTAANFVLFSSNGAVSNTGISQLTGNVGTNNGSSTAFGNVNGGMHDMDSVSAKCSTDVLAAYTQLAATTPNFFPSTSLGNGDSLIAGVYSITGATTLNGTLYLNAQGNANAVFIFKIQGAFSTSAGSKVQLINGAQACKVFWKIEGAVNMAAATTMRGTLVVNNAAIVMNAGDTLEGRAFSTTGAVSVDGVMAYTPVGCGSATLTGPTAPPLGSAACYAIFSSNGAVSNSGVTNVLGDVGTNTGLTTGFDTLLVTGKVHPVPDASTAQCATDLSAAYTFIDSLPYDIELLYPAQFGKNLVLTPHTYLLNAATTLTDTVYLNGMGNANAVFVIQIEGAFSTSTYSKVILTNGTQAKNVYWKIEGAVSINNYSVFCGTIICNNGALGALNTGVVLNGRALTTTGALTTAAVTVTMPPGCAIPADITTEPANKTVCAGSPVTFTVVATGTGLTYQWRRGGINVTNGGAISGATSATLTINPVSLSDASSSYYVIVGGAALVNDTSAMVSLTVNTAPVITTQPTNQIACLGSAVSFSVVATGAGLTYEWKKGAVTLGNTGAISGATSATLTINPINSSDTGSAYHVIISGTCSPADTSTYASLTLNAVTNITTEPVNQTVCAGTPAIFTVVATGTGLTYQWKRGTVNLKDSGAFSGVTSDTLTISPADTSDDAFYHVVVEGVCSSYDSSVNVRLTVNTAPIISVVPANQIACAGSPVNFTVTATGSGLTYQWRKGTSGLADGGTVSGATAATLTINPMSISDTASDYNVIVTGTCLPIWISADASLTLCDNTGIASFDAKAAVIFPNPFTTSISVILNQVTQAENWEWRMYNITGAEVKGKVITDRFTSIETGDLPSGIYFYNLIHNNKIVQTGKLISH